MYIGTCARVIHPAVLSVKPACHTVLGADLSVPLGSLQGLTRLSELSFLALRCRSVRRRA